MSSVPWMFQSHVADAKVRQFETALQAIAGLDWNAMTSDQALANLRDVIKETCWLRRPPTHRMNAVKN